MTVTPEQLKALRLEAGLNSAEAGRLVGFSISKNKKGSEYCSQWQKLEAGTSKLKPVIVELFILKAFYPGVANKAIRDTMARLTKLEHQKKAAK